MLGLSRVVNKPLNVCVAQITRSVASGSYAVDRSKYQNQLTDMRRTWLDDFARKKALKAEQDSEARRITIENRAIRIRERRNLSEIRKAEHLKWQEADQLRKRTYTAKNHVRFEKKVVKQNERFRRVAADLVHESQSWITAEDVKTRITADLFADEPTTTGIVTKYSNHWRYQTQSSEYQLQQALYPEQFVVTKTPEQEEEHRVAEHRFRHRQSVEEFLSSMVGSGEELLQLKDLVDDMVGDTIVNQGGLQDEWKEYHELFDRANMAVQEITAYENREEEFEIAAENPLLTDFTTPASSPFAEDNGKEELWEYEGKRHTVVTYPEEVAERNFQRKLEVLREAVFQKREAALQAGASSFVHDKQTVEISEKDRADYDKRARLNAKFLALQSKEDSFTWRGEKHVFTEEEKTTFAELQETERQELEEHALSIGETTYEFNDEVHDIAPEKIAEARAILAAKEEALAAGEEDFEFNGETYELTEEDLADYAEVANHRARLAALAQGADSYEFQGETYLFSAADKKEFAEEELWVDAKLAEVEKAFQEELASLVEEGEFTAEEAQVEIDQMVAGRATYRQQVRAELDERKEEYLNEKWLEEYEKNHS